MNNNGGREMSLSARTLSGLGWSYLATFIKALMSLLVLVILARLLEPVDFGLLAIAWIFILFGLRVGQAFVGPAIIQRSELTERHIQAGFTLSLIAGVSLAVIIYLLAPLVGGFFNEATASRVLQALSVIFLINSIGNVPVHLLRRELRFRELMFADILAYSIGYGFTAVILAFQGYGVWALVWGEIMHKVIHTLMVFRCTHVRLYPRWAPDEATDLLSTGAGFSLARLFEFIARQGGHFVIGRWIGAASLGFYTRADKLILLPRNYVSQGLFHVLFPAMAQRQRGTDSLASVYLHGTEILSLVALPIGVLLYVCAPEIVTVILGGQWGPVIVLLQILAFAVLFQMCDILNLAAIGAVGAVYRQAWRQAIHAFLVVSGAWFASAWGLESVVMAIVGAQVTAYLLLTQLTVSLLGLCRLRLVRCFLPALWTGAWVAVALWSTASQVRALHLPPLLSLFIEMLVWTVAVIAALYFAPRCVRPQSARWVDANIPFEVLGKPGQYLGSGLKWLLSERGDH